MQKEQLDVVVLGKLGITGYPEANLEQWTGFLQRYKEPKGEVNIGLVGKYVELKDAYKSIKEALDQAGAECELKARFRWVHSERLTPKNLGKQLGGLSGILVAPGFGHRGIEGKIEAIRYARENRVPFLGICLGMQCAVIEFARNVLEFNGANSTEMDANSPYPVIAMMEEQKRIGEQGRHHALGALTRANSRTVPRPARSTARTASASATAIGTSSTTRTSTSSATPACCPLA